MTTHAERPVSWEQQRLTTKLKPKKNKNTGQFEKTNDMKMLVSGFPSLQDQDMILSE